LVGGVQYPLRAVQRRGELGEIVEGGRVDDDGAGTLPAQLDEIRTLAIPVTAGALGVDGDGSDS
jgi:hypothetical protein